MSGIALLLLVINYMYLKTIVEWMDLLDLAIYYYVFMEA